jgi:hypothetical protein
MNEKLIEKYRDINVYHEWWEFMYENLMQDMEQVGINVEEKSISFSGFYSQGDGASFSATFDSKRFMEAHDLTKRYPGAYYFALTDELTIKTWKHPSHYSHSSTVSFESDVYSWTDDEAEDLRDAIHHTMMELYDMESKEFNQEVTDICRGYMDDFFKRLMQEYEYLTSDEVVWEAIVANELYKEEVA